MGNSMSRDNHGVADPDESTTDFENAHATNSPDNTTKQNNINAAATNKDRIPTKKEMAKKAFTAKMARYGVVPSAALNYKKQ